jgi:hypothetical protein
MAHWDASGCAVGYEGKKGDKLIRESLRTRKVLKKKVKSKKRGQPMKLDTKLKPVKGYVEAKKEEMDDLYDLFEVHETDDIDEILDGSVGVSEF